MRAPPPRRFRNARRPVQRADPHRAPSLAPSHFETYTRLRRLPARASFPRRGSCGSRARRRRVASRQLSPSSCSECDLGSYRPQRGPLPSCSFHGGTTSFGCRSSISFSAGFSNLASAHVTVYTNEVTTLTTCAIRASLCATRGFPQRTAKKQESIALRPGHMPGHSAQRLVYVVLIAKAFLQHLHGYALLFELAVQPGACCGQSGIPAIASPLPCRPGQLLQKGLRRPNPE